MSPIVIGRARGAWLVAGAIGLVLAGMIAAASCASAPRGVLTGSPPAPPEVRDACELATRRCSRCHPIDRVVVSRGIGVARWQMYIEQMRLKPSSGISPGDAAIIFRCLSFIEKGIEKGIEQGRS